MKLRHKEFVIVCDLANALPVGTQFRKQCRMKNYKYKKAHPTLEIE